ncbi:cell surface polysaccharide biosynthesis protein [Thermaurantimonas aggregans]|uniref:Cell surface polysaccharide biosynthesis protein n=1 Tax=Thermaurantimonas aggregans TaxID=2173829 RepID=A0A401XNA0_9FLAO|nr:DegT/DnrJ/EryC1/StrS family aminotransferase [Thermaurantimonas aggregans]MCX8148478.1 DegT/DnrJ/EryC1/StrS family aminotransferase [Thermaurantimonas aggregans]GCD78462.1 cell surface polysaccharide biosynthesis protein [Thermaurantimonas aggregans]
MKEIRMVDLATQYQHIKEEIDTAIQEVIESTAFINGPAVKRFKENLQKHLNVKHVIPCANGTDALQLAMMALDLQPGDEVITATFTYVATAEVIALLKLTPILVDVEEDSFLIDPEKIEKAITPRTKAIVPVHLFGQCADMERIMDIARRHNLSVIEDTAQAINADYTFSDGRVMKAGTIGHIGCTSFFPSKNLGCYGDGGAMFTNDDALAEKLRMIANHGQSVQYYHDIIGVNSRLDTIQAAILDVKLRRLDDYTRARQKAAAYYDRAFADHPLIKTPFRVANSTHVFHQYTLTLHPKVDRDALKKYLAEHQIPAMIYYPVPLHQQKAYRSDRYKDGDFPVAERLCKSVISLPMHTELTTEQQDHIITHIFNFLKQYNP